VPVGAATRTRVIGSVRKLIAHATDVREVASTRNAPWGLRATDLGCRRRLENRSFGPEFRAQMLRFRVLSCSEWQPASDPMRAPRRWRCRAPLQLVTRRQYRLPPGRSGRHPG